MSLMTLSVAPHFAKHKINFLYPLFFWWGEGEGSLILENHSLTHVKIIHQNPEKEKNMHTYQTAISRNVGVPTYGKGGKYFPFFFSVKCRFPVLFLKGICAWDIACMLRFLSSYRSSLVMKYGKAF